MTSNDLVIWTLLAMQGTALGIGFMVLAWVLAMQRRDRLRAPAPAIPAQSLLPARPQIPPRPTCWLAIRSVSPDMVQSALGLQQTVPCTWAEGLSGSHDFFISPRMNDWVIVTGMGLPNPTDDVDATFLFLSALSRQLGHVQYFYASRLLHHHAWARLDEGCVTRAYAWTGETAWNQGTTTRPEVEAALKMCDYGEDSMTILDAEMNFKKVPQLAARWSLDPANIPPKSLHLANGIAGESAFS